MSLLKTIFGKPNNEGDTLVISTGKQPPVEDDIVVETVGQIDEIATPAVPSIPATESSSQEGNNDFFGTRATSGIKVPTAEDIINTQVALTSEDDIKELLRGIATEIVNDEDKRNILARSVGLRIKNHLGITNDDVKENQVNELLNRFFDNLKGILGVHHGS